MEYVPEGGGSHHWRVSEQGGLHFVTVDDLDDKEWLGGSRNAVFAGLRRALHISETFAKSPDWNSWYQRSRQETANSCAGSTIGSPYRSSRM